MNRVLADIIELWKDSKLCFFIMGALATVVLYCIGKMLCFSNQDAAAWVQAIGSIAAIIAAWRIPLMHAEQREREDREGLRDLIALLTKSLITKLKMLHISLGDDATRPTLHEYFENGRHRDWPAMIAALNSIPITQLGEDCEAFMRILIAAENGRQGVERVQQTKGGLSSFELGTLSDQLDAHIALAQLGLERFEK